VRGCPTIELNEWWSRSQQGIYRPHFAPPLYDTFWTIPQRPKAGSPFASISPKTLTNQLIITKNRDRRLTEKKAEPSISSSIWLRGRRGTYSWYTEVVNQYVDQNLTFEKDKLVALSGIANKIAGLSGCQYIVGLWSEDIQHGLVW
jgi:hypothetical protein